MPGQTDTRTLWMESRGMRARKREREASRRKRTGCRETEPAGCCSAFKSCCSYCLHPHPPPHTHSRHALLLTAMSNRLITYLLRSSQQCIKTRCFLQLLPSSCTLGNMCSDSNLGCLFLYGNSFECINILIWPMKINILPLPQ